MDQFKSINIGGVIFYIEADAKEKFIKYKFAVDQYFAEFKQSDQIIHDIESRIAEIFLSKVSASKQFITVEDVNDLIKSMGSIEGFADETDEPLYRKNEADQSFQSSHTSQKRAYQEDTFATAQNENLHLYRDMNRKLLGGVCAGTAHYFHIDPLWVRLGIILPLFHFYDSFYFCLGLSILYIVAWMFIPGSSELKPDQRTKIFFRDPDQQVIAGVAAGVSNYLGIGIVPVRLIFVVTTLINGLGFFLYVVLWMISPKARSLKDKMQSSGQAINLENIEHFVKKKFAGFDSSERFSSENFKRTGQRISSEVSDLFNNDSFLVKLMRLVGIFAGFIMMIVLFVMLTMSGLASAFGLKLFTVSQLLGDETILNINNEELLPYDVALIDTFQYTLPNTLVIAMSLAVMLPLIYMGLVSISMIASKWVIGKKTHIVMGGIWLASLAVTGTSIGAFQLEYNASGSYQEDVQIPITTPYLRITSDFLGMNDLTKVSLDIKGYNGDDLKIINHFSSKGKTRQLAIANARTIIHDIKYDHDVLNINSHFKLTHGAPYKKQKLHLTLMIPSGVPFMIEDATKTLLEDKGVGFFDPFMQNRMWVFTEENFLQEYDVNMDSLNASHLQHPAIPPTPPTPQMAPPVVQSITDIDALLAHLPMVKKVLDPYKSVCIEGNITVVVKQGNKHYVKVPEPIDRSLRLRVKNNELHISKGNGQTEQDILPIVVYIKDLSSIKYNGSGQLILDEIASPCLTMDLEGTVNTSAVVNAEKLVVTSSDYANVIIAGTGDFLQLKVGGYANAITSDFKVDNIKVKTSGNCNVIVYADERAEVFSNPSSNVQVQGNPSVMLHTEN
ncbi:PspC domain-containing protein [Limibacter armeniacum]|uniref:PspC domain-containing protein n=1 Tax=Limibacter armeniacum TaxID=466084 RepID=UPI002FE548B3